MKPTITKFVLTGGPCAGKTTALSKIIEKLDVSAYLNKESWQALLDESAQIENGHYVYFLTTKRALKNNSRIETEKQITPSEYIQLLQQADPNRNTIHKKRRCFVWQNQYFEIDTFVDPPLPFSLLEIEGAENHDEINFPPFIKVLEDVTDNKEFYNSNLAKKK